jgi:hypothetical protein
LGLNHYLHCSTVPPISLDSYFALSSCQFCHYSHLFASTSQHSINHFTPPSPVMVTTCGNKRPLEDSQQPHQPPGRGHGHDHEKTIVPSLPSSAPASAAAASAATPVIPNPPPAASDNDAASLPPVASSPTPPSIAEAVVKESQQLSPSGYAHSDLALEPELPKDEARIIRNIGTPLWKWIQAFRSNSQLAGSSLLPELPVSIPRVWTPYSPADASN